MIIQPCAPLGEPDGIVQGIADTYQEGGVILECKVIHPPSRRGRRAYAYVPPEQVTALLLLARDAARRQRSRPDATGQ